MKTKYTPTSLTFSFYTPSQVLSHSVCTITSPITFDSFGHPLPNGLYDEHLGPVADKSGPCLTCHLSFHDCPGHFGHIKLAEEVLNPLSYDTLHLILNSVCTSCSFFKISQKERLFVNARLALLKKGHTVGLVRADVLEKSEHELFKYVENIINSLDDQPFNPRDHHSEVLKFLKECCGLKSCRNCNAKSGNFRKGRSKTLIRRGEIMLPRVLRSLLQKVVENEGDILGLCFNGFDLSIFFLEMILVTPNKFRPMSFIGSKAYESPCNDILARIIRSSRAGEGRTILSKKHKEKMSESYYSGETTNLEYSNNIDELYEDGKHKRKGRKRGPESYGVNSIADTLNISIRNESDEGSVSTNNFKITNDVKNINGVETVDDSSEDDIQDTYLNNISNIQYEEAEESHNIILEREIADQSNSVLTPDEFITLQNDIVLFFDSSAKTNRDHVIGVKQKLEKKDGLLRKHMMGKRVNYAARSVISPDPHLHTREIGIPMVFARTLTFPEHVTHFNADKLRRAVINGPKYPGANMLEMGSYSTGQIQAGNLNTNANTTIKYDLSKITEQRRSELASRILSEPTIVHRHLMNDDVLLVNRQPTLHKPSIMAHRARVLPGEKTIRMHYANCNSYNADFDGDEMNVHYLQSHVARAEGYCLMSTDHNYLVGTDGSPVRGLVQDHVVVCARMCLKNEFMQKEEFMHYIAGCITSNIDAKRNGYLLHEQTSRTQDTRVYIPPPAILRPFKMYTGKQIITAILRSMNIQIDHTSKSKMPTLEGGKVLIRDGVLLQGVLDKNQIGPTRDSLIHACGVKYGYSVCNELLTSFGRVINRVMQRQGFSARLDDLVLEDTANEYRIGVCRGSVDTAVAVGNNVVYTNRVSNTNYFINPNKLAQLDSLTKTEMNKVTSEIIDKSISQGQLTPFPKNDMALMISSGAKGSMVNLGQISGLLGQQELEGKRVPFMVSGTTLPCYYSCDVRPQAGGYIFGRFLDGINPSEYFFHCMAGREGLIDTAVKTARSGYLQRCLIKGLEGVVVEYDLSVRNEGDVVQFLYGEDDCDVLKKNNTSNVNIGSDAIGNAIGNERSVSPGEAVGILAAQSVGEPSTQMTLNTFHLAGVGSKNVTLGIPRLVEILMIASKTIKTPVLRVTLEESVSSDVIEKARRVTLRDITKKITIHEYLNMYDIEIEMDKSSVDGLNVGLVKKKISRLLDLHIKKGNKMRVGGIEMLEHVEESEQGEEMDKDDSTSIDSSTEEKEKSEEENIYEIIRNHRGETEKIADDDESSNEEVNSNKYNESRVNEKVDESKIVTVKLKFNLSGSNNILILPCIEKILPMIVVKEWHGIKGGSCVDNTVTFEGSDFYSLIGLITYSEIMQAYSNDIYSVLTTLGVEAARTVIVSEIRGVFDVYGINIDARHLMLIADYMTREGGYKPFSRYGMNYGRSILQKMSFESCYTYLKEGCVFGEEDFVSNPSSCLVLGAPVKVGSGKGFDLFYEIDD